MRVIMWTSWLAAVRKISALVYVEAMQPSSQSPYLVGDGGRTVGGRLGERHFPIDFFCRFRKSRVAWLSIRTWSSVDKFMCLVIRKIQQPVAYLRCTQRRVPTYRNTLPSTTDYVLGSRGWKLFKLCDIYFTHQCLLIWWCFAERWYMMVFCSAVLW